MKTKIFQIAMAAMLLMVGCAKDEIIDESVENLQLKKGSACSMVSSVSFPGNSVNGEYFSLTELADRSIILKNGQCSGSITGYGKINPSLSTYKFTSCDAGLNPTYGQPGNPELKYYYYLDGEGKVSLNQTDYFEFTITDANLVSGNLSPVTYEPGYTGSDAILDGLFCCNNIGQGSAVVTKGSGKFKTWPGKPIGIYNGKYRLSIDRSTGRMDLSFQINTN